jgi:hypothetical protein
MGPLPFYRISGSGFVRPENQERAHGMGIRDLILKPDAIDQLGCLLAGGLHRELADPLLSGGFVDKEVSGGQNEKVSFTRAIAKR